MDGHSALWGRGDGVYGPTFERYCVCFCLDVRVRFWGVLVRAGRATRPRPYPLNPSSQSYEFTVPPRRPRG
eukprot:3386520-Prymnesium_polylepis.1